VHSKTKIESKNKQYKESREKIRTPRIVHPVWSNLTYYGGEIDLSNPLSMSSYKEIQNGLQEISFNKLTKNNPNFYPCSQSHQWTRHSWIFTLPRCLQLFPNTRI